MPFTAVTFKIGKSSIWLQIVSAFDTNKYLTVEHLFPTQYGRVSIPIGINVFRRPAGWPFVRPTVELIHKRISIRFIGIWNPYVHYFSDSILFEIHAMISLHIRRCVCYWNYQQLAELIAFMVVSVYVDLLLLFQPHNNQFILLNCWALLTLWNKQNVLTPNGFVQSQMSYYDGVVWVR